MNSLRKISLSVVMLAALAACQTTPKANDDLTAARQAYEQARGNPYAAKSAAIELERAQQALRRAEAAAAGRADKEEVQALAYVARRRAETVSALAEQAQAEERVQQAGGERDRVRLEARTREAEAATQRARAAQANAQSAQATARTAQTEVERSREEADALRKQAAEQAERARMEAERARMESERARTESGRATEQSQRAAALERDLQSLRGKQTERGIVVTMGDVLFATGRAQLQPGAKRNIEHLAAVLKQYPERRVLVEGFTDSQGSAESNMVLSQRRADAFRQALVEAGVPADRIDVQAHGEEFPVASNATPAGRQQNRRVEVLFSDEQGRFAGR